MIKKVIMIVCVLFFGVLLIYSVFQSVGQNTSRNDELLVDSDSIICIDSEIDISTENETNVEEPGEVINERSFKVLQVVDHQSALVYGKDEYGYYSGTLYLFQHSLSDILYKKVSPLYDDQIIKVPKGKVVRLVGTYSYETMDNRYKTVPKVRMFDK